MIYEYGYKIPPKSFKRNIYLPLDEIVKLSANKEDQYYTIFGYESEDIDNSLLFGPMYFDIDSEDDLQRAYSDMRMVMDTLAFYGLTENEVSLFFSGHKGFHILIDPIVFNVQPMKQLDAVYKKIAEWFLNNIASTIDMKVYEKKRLWRIPNTRNGKSGLYKIPIRKLMSLDEILEKAKTPQVLISKTPQPNKVLSGWIDAALHELTEKPKLKKLYSQTEDKKISATVTQIINTGVSKGDRNATVFYLGCYLKSKGFTQEEAKGQIEIFCKNCTPIYNIWHEVDRTIQSAYKNTSKLPTKAEFSQAIEERKKIKTEYILTKKATAHSEQTEQASKLKRNIKKSYFVGGIEIAEPVNYGWDIRTWETLKEQAGYVIKEG